MVPGIRRQALTMAAYVPGKTTDAVIEQYKLTKVVKLGSNENNYAPFPSAMEAMTAELQRINVYPEKNYVRLKNMLGLRNGLDGDWVGIGHGAGGVLETIARCFLESGDEVILPSQTYGLYKEISKVMGAEIAYSQLTGYTIDLDDIIGRITPRTKLVWLCNPNNPTSTVFGAEGLPRLLDALPATAWVVLDEAYREYADPTLLPDTVELIRQGRHILAVRTFSKYFGLAGGRIGYLLAAPEVITYYDTVSEPFNANRIGLAGAVATLQGDGETLQRCAAAMMADRERIIRTLRDLGCTPEVSHTNFVFFRTPYPCGQVNELLLRRGVIARPCAGWSYPDHMRVSIGTMEETRVFLAILADVLAQCAGESAQ